ncbi:MAG: UDP-N-acetylmuramate dehydrogenase [Myxococcota bacterium]|nr:UDP-N-acetylmuramate dehydrogenase [Myxococcota bacterium]
MARPDYIKQDVPLHAMTTLDVGGHAEFFLESNDPSKILEAAAWAKRSGVGLTILGGGSNVVIHDAGVKGRVLRYGGGEWSTTDQGQVVELTLGAGLNWDDVVRRTVQQDLVGIECLVGIPGWVGAAPIQNIGAYGQEIADTALRVEALDLVEGEPTVLSAEACGFGYRTSRFKTADRGRYLVTALTLGLRRGGQPTIRYGQLRDRLPEHPSVRSVMEAVARLRREKSMLAGGRDENARSVGSFFLNPILRQSALNALQIRVAERGIDPEDLPVWPVSSANETSAFKVPAAWLIERAGMSKGWGAGPVGLSTNHTLAIVNRGEASAGDVTLFARSVKAKVLDAFGIALEAEPQFLGYSASPI